MKNSSNKDLYSVIDQMIDNAVDELAADNMCISCKKGCAHCCHLLIEVSWEEALELAQWVKQLPVQKRQQYIERIQANAADARNLFSQTKRGRRFMNPVEGDYKIPDKLFNDYFYQARRPCPFLVDNVCSAYDHRPSPCRLHLVTSPAKYCSADSEDYDDKVDVPDAFEGVRDDIGPVISHLHRDPRWGHFGIMVEAALQEIGAL